MLAGKFREQSYLALRAYNRRSKQSVHGKRGLRVIRTRYSRVCHDKTTKLRRFRENSYQKVVSFKALKARNSLRNMQNTNQNLLNKSTCLKFLEKHLYKRYLMQSCFSYIRALFC